MRTRWIALTAALVAGLSLAARAGTGKVEARDQIPELKGQAAAGLTEDRVKAIEQLGAVNDEQRLNHFQVPDFLLGILQDGDNNSVVRGAAADALARITRYVPAFTDKALIPLIERLQDRREALYVRLKITQAMGTFLEPESISHKMAFSALERIAKDRQDKPSLVAAVLVALGDRGYAPAIQAAIAAVRDRNPIIRTAGGRALASLLKKTRLRNPEDLVRQLVAIVSDEKVPVKMRMVFVDTLVSTLSQPGVQPRQVAVPLVALLDKLRNQQPELSAAVVRVLARVPDASSVAALKKTYATFSSAETAPFVEVRATVAKVLGEYFHPLAKSNQMGVGQGVAAELIDISKKDKSDRVAKAAIFSLGLMDSTRYNRTEAVKNLIDAMARDKSVEAEAYQSLIRATSADMGRDAKKWKEWFEANKRELLPSG